MSKCERPSKPKWYQGWSYCTRCGARNDSPCPNVSAIDELMNNRQPGDMPTPVEFREASDADHPIMAPRGIIAKRVAVIIGGLIVLKLILLLFGISADR